MGGVAACLGLLYYDHPIICKQNKLQVYAFASPCIVSKEFTEKNIGNDYISSVALSTDLVTRLSLESVKHENCRLDAIMRYPQEVIRECIVNVTDLDEDEMDDDDKNDDNRKHARNRTRPLITLKPKDLVKTLKELKTPNPKEQLFPLGKILWFVPKAAMDDDDLRRRRTLMCLKENANVNTNDDDESKENKKEYKTHNTKNSSLSEIFKTIQHNVTKGFEDFQETMDNSLLGSGTTKYVKKYDGSNYILCDATKCRAIFQELVLDLPESLYAHLPSRYLWACGAHLTRGNLHD